jgi:hypothetical protein
VPTLCCGTPDPDEKFERRLAEEEDGKNNLWQSYISGSEFGRAHITCVLDSLGFLYGERVKEEVRNGLLCSLYWRIANLFLK